MFVQTENGNKKKILTENFTENGVKSPEKY